MLNLCTVCLSAFRYKNKYTHRGDGHKARKTQTENMNRRENEAQQKSWLDVRNVQPLGVSYWFAVENSLGFKFVPLPSVD